MRIKLSDYIADYLVEKNITQVFMLTGGGAMHLNDSLGNHAALNVTCNHHEQACAMAAESYARLSNKLAVVNVTTGPGGLNTLNGVFGAWTDSLPMLIISGQVKYATTVRSTGLPLRQMGDQEFDIISCVKTMTKYAEMVVDPLSIKHHLDTALHVATQGRPGPVWLDIPLDVQGAMIDLDHLHLTHPLPEVSCAKPVTSENTLQHVMQKIDESIRPVLLVGTGIRISGAHDVFLKLIELLNIPICTAFNAHDVINYDHPLLVGKAGTVGDRAGNFVVQNSDLLIILGCRLNIRQISYHHSSFARAAYKIMVDIDEAEMHKPTLAIELPIHADLKEFLTALYGKLLNEKFALKTETTRSSWLNWCAVRKKSYPVVLPEYWQSKNLINPYCFMQALNDHTAAHDIIVTANATACIVAFQVWQIKNGQRMYSNSGSASMGYDLPAAIGACIAGNYQQVICLAGDGSLQMNIQELATIRQYKLPIKIFILNNAGYHSIRQTQKNYFTNLVGVGAETGLFFPHLEKIAAAYEIEYAKCDSHATMAPSIQKILQHNGPAICEVMLDQEQAFAPKTSSKKLPCGKMISRPLEDMAPFLSRQEFADNMLIDLLPEE